MKSKSLLSALAAVIAIGLFCGGSASAEEMVKSVADITENGSYRYKLYHYPSSASAFFFIPHSYVTFDAVNGKYWKIESHRMRYEMIPRLGWYDLFPLGTGYHPMKPEKLDVFFYTPDMKLLGSFEDVYCNRRYSIPRDGNDYERIVVKIVCESEENQDLKMFIWDPVDAVMAEPVPRSVYRR